MHTDDDPDDLEKTQPYSREFLQLATRTPAVTAQTSNQPVSNPAQQASLHVWGRQVQVPPSHPTPLLFSTGEDTQA